jgi:hypothetical protein
LCVALVGFVMADDASGNGAKLAVVPGHMARHASDDSALNASLRFSGGGSEHDAEQGSTKDQRLHDSSPGE